MTKNRALIAVLVTFAIAALLAIAQRFVPISPNLLIASRWAVISSLVLYGLYKRTLTTWIFVAMVVGAEIGHDFPTLVAREGHINARLFSMIFLRMIKTIIAPLLFGTLVAGIAGHADLKKVGRMGVKAIIYFEVVTTLALVLGLTAINLSRAGEGVQLPTAHEQITVTKQTASDVILHVFPENIAKSVADGQVLQVVVFSVFFGIALAMVREEKRRPLLTVVDGLVETMFKFTNIVMYFAPVGAGAAIAYTVATTGLGVLSNLAKLVATLYVSLIAFVVFVLIPVALIARVPLRRFARAVAEPFSIAFATANSEAALPRAMESMERLGVPREIAAFVIPTGYSFNLDGSTLYLAVASIFVAQAAGVHLSIGQQVVLMLTLMLTSKGVAGVSRGALVILLGTVGSFGLPVEPVFILLGIDQLLDMARTSINVLGNCLATVVIARWEGDFQTKAVSDFEFQVSSSGQQQ